MPRPPSKHGLENKFKSWRKGKSTKAGSSASRASLKNRLRSQKRLLSKLPDDDAGRGKIEETIRQLEMQITGKQQVQKERKNAEKYHQVRFFDRQRLTRLERTSRRQLEEATAAADVDEVKKYKAELESIILDKLYVGYFPNDTKYIALFRNGEKIEDDDRTARLRQAVRDRIASDLKSGKLKSKSWLNVDEIKGMSCLKFAGSKPYKRKADQNKDRNEEKESGSAANQNIVPAKKKKPNVDISNDDIESVGESDSSSSSSSSDDSDNDSSDEENVEKPRSKVGKKISGENSSDDSSSSSSSSSSSDSDSSSSSSDSDSEDRKESKAMPLASTANAPSSSNVTPDEDSDDDFLVEESTGVEDTFNKARQYSTGYEYEKTKGDKSRGWATQKQRPGQWNRHRR